MRVSTRIMHDIMMIMIMIIMLSVSVSADFFTRSSSELPATFATSDREGHVAVTCNISASSSAVHIIAGRNRDGIYGMTMNDIFTLQRNSTGQLAWKRTTVNAPFRDRHYHSVIVTPDNSLLLAAGFSGTSTYLNDVWFNSACVDDSTWTQLNTVAPMFPPRASPAMVYFRGSAFIFGGFHASCM